MADGFVWYELMTSDAGAAKAFYRSVVGWETEDLGGPHRGYSLFKAAGNGVAGLMALPAESCEKGARPGWIGYVGVADADSAAAAIDAAGGAVLRAPDDIPMVGRFAVVADPGGAAFMLLTPAPGEHAPPESPRMTPGRVGWHELHASDGDSAFAFYNRQFGWSESAAMDMGPMGTYRLWSVVPGGEPIGGMMTRPPQMPKPAWLFYFVVDSVDSAAERIRAAGGQVTNGPMEVPDGSWIVRASDPQGAMFALVSEKR